MNEDINKELLETLEECVSFLRAIPNQSPAYTEHAATTLAEELESLLSRAKGGAA